MRRVQSFFLSLVFVAGLLATWSPNAGHAYINQADGTVVPPGTPPGALQQCLNRSEGVADTSTMGPVDAVGDAATLPEAFRPVFDAVSGHYRVTFTDIGEGAGYRNSFGWYWTGTDVTNTDNLHTIFGCRTYGACACPCGTTREVTIDFDTQSGFSAGRPIGFWLRTPERQSGGSESGTFPTGCSLPLGCDPTVGNVDDSCGGRLDTNNRIYFTSQSLNDDGDYVHYLVYRSVNRTNTYYFGFEDLWRGGDNDFEDMLTRGTGLVPTCDPRPETCNNADDDCDGLIDDGLTQTCSTTCGSGTRTCSAGVYGACSARTPGTETCNNTDDDCDASVDEGLSRACSNSCGSGTEICVAGTYASCNAPTPTLEDCDNRDDDCDGRVDEGLTRACSTSCGGGTQACAAGAWGACSAETPTTESCNADDDDCDGRVDEGLSRACSNACGAGTEVCRAGDYVGCTAPSPGTEACNNADDDCDGSIDEGITRVCSTACGVGTEQCVAGSFAGCDAPTAGVETCNNVDDDCDGVIDDGNPGGGDACVPLPGGGYTTPGEGDGGVTCSAGTVRCVSGALVCQGASSGGSEVCNCLDDDCDGQVDEDSTDDPLCPGGACIATECACASPCDSTEFPCPPGRICDRSLAHDDVIGYCVAGSCAGVTCDDESTCDPDTGECVNLCDGVTCPTGRTCVRGSCVEDNCYGLGCPTGQLCRTADDGTASCIDDACASVTCDSGTFCRDGACIATCDIECPSGQVCRAGACVEEPCGGCASGSSCVDGACVVDACGTAGCGRGRVCRGTSCVDDPCSNITCPGALTCSEGECVDPNQVPGTEAVRALASGGGCLCTAAGTSTSTSSRAPFAIVALLFALVLGRRPRVKAWALVARRVAPSVAAALVLGVALSGCSVDPFCFSGCDETTTDGSVVGNDGGIIRPADGCVASGDETCDSIDNDCDGLVDETFDTETDPANCGACGTSCVLPHAFPGCAASECSVSRCEIGWVDLDGVPSNGCEYSCPPDGDELCDLRDNDCDGRVDEGFDTTTDLGNCGACGNQCQFSNATASCVDSTCVSSGCRPGFVDLDGDESNGCEYACSATGVETCNGVDDDCDRRIDETFDVTTDAANCGTCGHACTFPSAVGRCIASTCSFSASDCLPGHYDIDGDPATGCEYECAPTGAADTCDGVDDDCDGRVDESDPSAGTACGTTTGACEAGVTACVRGGLTCVGGVSAISELCNSLDDDCDGRVDESTVASPIPSVGDRCGATDVGACAYGTVACTSGALTCSGAVTSATETCNGVDDDCDGATDDGLVTPSRASVASCAETRGVCAGRTPTCRGASGWGCDLPTSYQATETLCDTLDNDCDGTADEGCLAAVGTTDTRIDTQNTASSTNSLNPAIIDSSANAQLVWTETVGSVAHVYRSTSTDSGATWSTGNAVDTASGPTFAPRVLYGSTNVLWSWADFRGGSSYREIWTRRSTDAAGSTLAASAVRANSAGATSTTDSYNTHLARLGANYFVTYEAFTGTRTRHIFFSRSTDGGATWATPTQVSTATGTSFVAAEPRIAAAGTRAYVVWRDNRSGSLDVYLRAWNDSTATFPAAEVRIDTGTVAGSSSSFAPEIAAEGNNVYVAWVDDRDAGSFDIWFNRSSDSGATWLSTATKLDGDSFAHDSIEPHVVAPASGIVLVGWLDYRNGFPDPYFIRSSSAGASFGTPTRVDTGSAAGVSGSYELALAATGNLVAMAWSDDRAGLLDVFVNYSLDQGVTWQPQDYRMDTATAGASDSQQPTIAVTSNRIDVAWIDHRRGSGCPAGTGTTDSCPQGDVFYRRMQ